MASPNATVVIVSTELYKRFSQLLSHCFPLHFRTSITTARLSSGPNTSKEIDTCDLLRLWAWDRRATNQPVVTSEPHRSLRCTGGIRLRCAHEANRQSRGSKPPSLPPLVHA